MTEEFEDPDYDAELEALHLSQQSDEDPILLDLSRQHWESEHKSRNLNDIAEGRVIRPPWLFEDFLLSNSLTLVSGEPFAGKTMLLAAMLLSLDSGEPLAGEFIPQPGRRALFIGQDAPTWDYMGQIQKLGSGLKTSHNSKIILNNGFNILEPRFLKMVEEAVDFFNINVLMLDTLLELHGMDENSNTEMRRVMGLLKYLRDKHYLSILVTTHTAKDKDKSANYRARGASVIAGSVDQHLIISPHNNGEGFRFKVPKSRGGQNSPDSSIIKFVVSEPGAPPSLRLEYAGEAGDRYSERQAQVVEMVSRGIVVRKDVLAELSRLYPAWTPLELQRRTTTTLSYLVKKGRLLNTDRGLYSLPNA